MIVVKVLYGRFYYRNFNLQGRYRDHSNGILTQMTELKVGIYSQEDEGGGQGIQMTKKKHQEQRGFWLKHVTGFLPKTGWCGGHHLGDDRG
jgi:hypothetical protein